jgi:hypothetical protein
MEFGCKLLKTLRKTSPSATNGHRTGGSTHMSRTVRHRYAVRDFKHRLTTLELQVTNLASTESSHYAGLAIRMDRTDDQLDRIEQRLEIVATL